MTRNSRISISRLAAVGIIISVQSVMGVQQAQAGLLELLFGRTPEPVAVAPAPAPMNPIEFRRPKKPDSSSIHSAAAVKAAVTVALCCKEGGDPMRALLSDPTLRDGDAVMTDHGMTIFRGSVHDKVHQPQDFVLVAKAGNVSPTERVRISALARTNSQ
jgi:hypothetical protein